MDVGVGMIVYSLLLTAAVVVSAPWWLWRMLTSGRYREGLGERLGRVPAGLRGVVGGKRVAWVHAVSVGEVLAAQRLVGELGAALGTGWVVVVSTTTATGQKVARERFGAGRVFYFPLDFGFAVRRYLRVLKPELMVLMESELWPRHLVECARAGVPVAVVNARVSDRSFPRYMRMQWVWRRLFGKVRVFLAQGEEAAGRLRAIGAERVRVVGNLKYDLGALPASEVAAWVQRIADGRPVVLAGSTLADRNASAPDEEQMMIQAWEGALRAMGVLLVIAPRHPERFGEVFATASEFNAVKASTGRAQGETTTEGLCDGAEIVVLDTIGDLAAVYGVATVAFVGGSLVAKGGHNPLEAARFGVPVVMGPSYENFREIVDGMRAADAIRIVGAEGLAGALAEELKDGAAMGARGRVFFESQAGATGRTVAALLELIREKSV